MTPTSLATLTIAPAATAQAAAPLAGQIAPVDFMSMLGQLAGAPLPQAAVASSSSPAPAPAPAKKLDDCEEVGIDLLAMFPLSLPVTQPSAPLFSNPGAQTGMTIDISDITSQGSSSSTSDLRLLSDLLRGDQELTPDGTTTDFRSVQLSATTETNHPARASAAEAAAYSRPVHQPVGSAAWADEIGSRLTLMAEQGKHTASLRLSPEHLGPLEIRIAIRDDQASVWFGAAHADTRAAIETALPRLRELFESQGLSLADAGVFREPPRDQAKPTLHPTGAGGEAQASDEAGVVVRRSVLGLIDAYA